MIPARIDTVIDQAIVERFKQGRTQEAATLSILNAWPQHPELTGQDITKRIETLKHFGIILPGNTIDASAWTAWTAWQAEKAEQQEPARLRPLADHAGRPI